MTLRRLQAVGRRIAAGWHGFWFEPRSTSTLALFRIVYGSLVAIWAAALLPDATSFLSSGGVLPEPPREGVLQPGLLDALTSDWAASAAVGALLVAGVLLAVGFHTRLVSVVSFVLLLSITRRNPEVLNSGDLLLRNFGFFLMLAPAGASLSWDRWRRHRESFWSAPRRAPWAQRLIQIQVSLLYLYAAVTKIVGEGWIPGTALADVWRSGDIVRFDVPLFVSDSLQASIVGSYWTLFVELSLAVFIWSRALRPYVIGLGLMLHAGIEVTMAVGFFSAAACSGYVAFVPEERADRVIAWVRRRVQRFRAPRAVSPATGR